MQLESEQLVIDGLQVEHLAVEHLAVERPEVEEERSVSGLLVTGGAPWPGGVRAGFVVG